MAHGFVAALLLSVALCVDTLVAGFSYGAGGIRIPPLSAAILTAVCSATLALSLLLGSLLRAWIPAGLAESLSFILLLLLGVYKLFEGVVQALIRKHASFQREIHFSLLRLRCILRIYADPARADVDQSLSLSAWEAVWLGMALSLDSLAVGFGAAMAQVSIPLALALTVPTQIAALTGGCALGRRLRRRDGLDLLWLGGLLLLILAFARR